MIDRMLRNIESYIAQGDNIKRDLRQIRKLIGEHNSRLYTISTLGWAHIAGQHFLLPIVAALVAIWLLWGWWLMSLLQQA
jgi:hypothetical protein